MHTRQMSGLAGIPTRNRPFYTQDELEIMAEMRQQPTRREMPREAPNAYDGKESAAPDFNALDAFDQESAGSMESGTAQGDACDREYATGRRVPTIAEWKRHFVGNLSNLKWHCIQNYSVVFIASPGHSEQPPTFE